MKNHVTPVQIVSQKIYLSSDLKQHRTVHGKVKEHFCNHGNGKKFYMNKQDLLKHAHAHTNKELLCEHCDYTTMDKHLLQSHMKLHEDVKL